MKLPFSSIAWAIGVLLGVGGCAGTTSGTQDPASAQPSRQIDQLIEQQRGKTFRSEPYLELAAALQAMPPGDAEKQLRNWAQDGKYDAQVLVLCRMLFAGPDHQPLPQSPYLPIVAIFTTASASPPYWMTLTKFSFGGTRAADWPDWPLVLIDRVPFCIQAAPGAYSGTYPPQPLPLQAPGYLDYCLKAGRWTDQRYEPRDLSARQKALAALLGSTNWKRALSPQEIKYLTYQTSPVATQSEPEVPSN